MIKVLLVFCLFCSVIAHGQIRKGSIYKDIDGLTTTDLITWKDIVDGFYISDGFGGYNFRLDSNMTFHKIDFSCTARFAVDSGSWTIKNNNTVVLKSNKQTLYFDIVKFDNFYFFILPKQRQKFIADLRATKIKFINAKPFKIDDRIYPVNYMIGGSLLGKYYAKEIEEMTGI